MCTIKSPIRLYWFNFSLAKHDMPCLSKQCRSRSVGFWRSQLIWICTVCHSVCDFISIIWINELDWLTIRTGRGILIYSAWQGLSLRWAYMSEGTCSSMSRLICFLSVLNVYGNATLSCCYGVCRKSRLPSYPTLVTYASQNKNNLQKRVLW